MTWRIGLATGACIESPLVEALSAIAESGVVGVELSTPPRHFDPAETAQVDAAARGLAATGLEPISIHAPFGVAHDLAHPDQGARHAGIAAIVAAAAALARLGGRFVVVHPSDLPRVDHAVGPRLDDCAASLRELDEACRRLGVAMAIESPLPHLIGGHPDEFGFLLARLDGSARACLDTGHTALGGHWRQFVDVAGARLAHVHVSDNRGHRDDHLPPGDGTIDWPAVVHSLRTIRYDGWLMLELTAPADALGPHFTRAVAQAMRVFGS